MPNANDPEQGVNVNYILRTNVVPRLVSNLLLFGLGYIFITQGQDQRDILREQRDERRQRRRCPLPTRSESRSTVCFPNERTSRPFERTNGGLWNERANRSFFCLNERTICSCSLFSYHSSNNRTDPNKPQKTHKKSRKKIRKKSTVARVEVMAYIVRMSLISTVFPLVLRDIRDGTRSAFDQSVSI